MKCHDLALNGAKLLELSFFKDERGSFIKTFNSSLFKNFDIDFELKESYFSYSKKDVIRGMHFQLPPHDHSKIVFCPKGAILDIIIDLRKSSKTFGQYHSQILSEENNNAFFIPKGFAHGFKALENESITYYLVSSEYHKESDTGILWDSFGFDWKCKSPLISERDQLFIPLDHFNSPF
ncbi:MAG TPA: dTDP-4-dehydrorhamnose 3,5-epimerase [Edaphocola sp.]|nr:dTDP-4-dehydrorhamnose 3,5-epimerase [Edaphocola sp.]